ncbi:MAG: hypothetical protein ACPIOQ_34710 [Promethearchaeia archaeon]
MALVHLRAVIITVCGRQGRDLPGHHAVLIENSWKLVVPWAASPRSRCRWRGEEQGDLAAQQGTLHAAASAPALQCLASRRWQER